MAQLKGMMMPPCKNPASCYPNCKNGAFPCKEPSEVTYTTDNIRKHRLVKAAVAKKLTNVKISRILHREWILECDQVARLRLGYGMIEAENRINQISI